jgi:DNA-binding response OmpR family regulator
MIQLANGGEKGSARILMIDDDVKFCRLMRDYLAPQGFTVVGAHTGESGVDAARQNGYQAIILDVRLPGMTGFEVLRKLRANLDVPVMMLTAHGEEPDLIVGFELGADDYVPKTASPRELLARIKALIRRRERPLENRPIRIGNLKLDPSTREGWIKEKPLVLSSFEFDLLLSLAKSAGSIKTRESLLRETAARSRGAIDRTIDVHISSLRKKMGDDVRDPEYIVTVRNTGYMLKRLS